MHFPAEVHLIRATRASIRLCRTGRVAASRAGRMPPCKKGRGGTSRCLTKMSSHEVTWKPGINSTPSSRNGAWSGSRFLARLRGSGHPDDRGGRHTGTAEQRNSADACCRGSPNVRSGSRSPSVNRRREMSRKPPRTKQNAKQNKKQNTKQRTEKWSRAQPSIKPGTRQHENL